MSIFGIVALLAGLGVAGYVGYDIYKSYEANTPAAKIKATANTAAKYGLLGVAGLAYEYGGTALSDVDSAVAKGLSDFESVF